MPTSTQSIREIVSTEPSAAAVLQRFEIDLCSQAELPLERACAELQLSVDQVLEKLSDAETNEHGAALADPAALSLSRLIQHIVRVHHQYVRQELPRLAEMAHKLAGKHGDRAPELKNVEALLEELRADHDQASFKKKRWFCFHLSRRWIRNCSIGGATPRACFRSVAQPISMMMQEHDSANHIVAELRRLTQGFRPPEWACATHIAFFTGLDAFESNLKQHVHLENDLLFPRAIELEAALNRKG